MPITKLKFLCSVCLAEHNTEADAVACESLPYIPAPVYYDVGDIVEFENEEIASELHSTLFSRTPASGKLLIKYPCLQIDTATKETSHVMKYVIEFGDREVEAVFVADDDGVCALLSMCDMKFQPGYSEKVKEVIAKTTERLSKNDKPLPPPELTWIYTHCRAIGMTCKSDSGKWEEDIALWTSNLVEENKVLKERLESVFALDIMQNDAPVILNDVKILELDVPNKLGHLYPSHVVEEAIKNFKKQYGRIGMPEINREQLPIPKPFLYVEIDDASHQVQSLRIEGHNLLASIKVLDTPMGKGLRKLIEDKIDFCFAPAFLCETSDAYGVSVCKIIKILSINVVPKDSTVF